MNNSGTARKIGLALGSGASRSWSHIGIVKALTAAGIEPDIVCGTSVGAMVGAAYLTGSMQELEDWVLGTTRADVLRFFDVKLGESGFVDTPRFSKFLRTYVAGGERRIEELPRQYAAVATVLDTGRETWLTEGRLDEAVRASMAMPGLFPSVRIDGRWLVDGGLVNPVPVSVCRALGADIVIAVNLNSGIVGKHVVEKAKRPADEDNGVLGAFRQQARQYTNAILPSRDHDDEPPGLFYAITIREGERCVHDDLDDIRRAIGKLSADAADAPMENRKA